MQFVSGTKRKQRIKQEHSDPSASYDNVLQFYKIPPRDTISLQKFEECAVERLKVLKAVENAGIRFTKSSNEYSELLEKEIRNTAFKLILRTSLDDDLTESDLVARKMDHISHFILRLAYCRSEELRRWFLQQELEFFRFRFQRIRKSTSVIEDFMKRNCLDYQPISGEEKNDIHAELAQASGSSYVSVMDTVEFFKVPFTEALDLVRSRRVYLKMGFAYVPRDELVSILLTFYRSHLSHALAVTSRALPQLEEDNRLLPMLCGLSKRYLGQDYTNRKPTAGQITADMIDMLTKKSFPPCMHNIHQHLKQNHHIRHGSRMQYGLFLKGIGMSLEEAMKLMRGEFTKVIDGDKFDKQYGYGVRHLYGKEGKRTDYTPYSCMKIITSNAPGPGDSHGCPFRHMDPELMKQRLRSQSLSKDGVEKIMDFVKGGHYQLACTAYFQVTHNVSDDDITQISIQHPNQYFEESQKEIKGDRQGLTGTPRTPRAVKIVGPQKTSMSQVMNDSTQLTDTMNDSTQMTDNMNDSTQMTDNMNDSTQMTDNMNGSTQMTDNIDASMEDMDDCSFMDAADEMLKNS